MLKVKICGITNMEDAEIAVENGADALGFVFYQQSPRAVTPETAREIISSIPPFITSVGVFVNEKKNEVERISSLTGINIIQLHGSEPPEYCDLRRKVIKAIRIREDSDIDIMRRYSRVSAFLLDTYSPDAMGGTGQTFNWNIAARARQFGKIILAGGLTPDNVEEAVATVQPYAVDVSSGVESNARGVKDHNKLKLFLEKARRASFRA